MISPARRKESGRYDRSQAGRIVVDLTNLRRVLLFDKAGIEFSF